jgi:hypothetical protein
MILRIVMKPNVMPDIEQAAETLRAQYPNLDIAQETITVDGKDGLLLYTVPGADPNSYIYVVANDTLYEIIYAAETVDERGAALLSSIHFEQPGHSLDSLDLPDADEAAFQTPIRPIFPKGAEVRADIDKTEVEGTEYGPDSILACADWPTWKFMQTPIASDANGTGWSNAGPSYYGEGRHQDCSLTNKINDYHALDYDLNTGNYIYAPSTGTVIWAGTAGCGWSDFGNIVIVDHGNGYWSMSAHLNAVWVSYGNTVTASTVIGTAGQSGGGASYPHLHQGVYKSATLNNSCGGIYAGQSVEPHNMQYFGHGGGTYSSIAKYQAISY